MDPHAVDGRQEEDQWMKFYKRPTEHMEKANTTVRTEQDQGEKNR